MTAGFFPEPGAIVFDVGVCDGGTTAIYSDMGYKVYGFEPDKANYKLSKKVAEKHKFILENIGFGSYKHTANFSHFEGSMIGSSKLDKNGTETVEITTIDSYVRENKIPRVDLIKFDTEGAELDILKGAAATIARWKPMLALSAYHKWDDFWTLMNFLKSIRPDYEFALRQYRSSREDNSYQFNDESEEFLNSLGLDPYATWFGECVIHAR